MATTWDIHNLEEWDEKCMAKAREFGLDCYPQDFEICDHREMIGYMAYAGMPSHYPHWSYGKSYEMTETLYQHGVTGLPYEMVINANPSIAYLMRGNTLALQILTIAHVYGHNDFFKNNFTFQRTDAGNTVSRFKAHANRVRAYIADPSIGQDKVDVALDAAHSLSLQCRRNMAVKKLSLEEDRERLRDLARPREDPFYNLHRHEKYEEPDLKKIPASPEEDILLFIAKYHPTMPDWERDLLTIVHEGAQYFIPQIETKIMNEGWASFWHHRILNSLKLPQDLHLEFLVRHSQVLTPMPGGLNPYHLGLTAWHDIEHRYDEALAGKICEEHEEEYDRNGYPGDFGQKMTGLQKVFEVRSSDRDVSFLRRFLNEHLIRKLDLFHYAPKGNDLVIDKVADGEGWRVVREKLCQGVGMGSIPSIQIVDAGFGGDNVLELIHNHDGRDLQLEYAEKTLAYLHKLWGREVSIATVVGGKRTQLVFNDQGLATKSLK